MIADVGVVFITVTVLVSIFILVTLIANFSINRRRRKLWGTDISDGINYENNIKLLKVKLSEINHTIRDFNINESLYFQSKVFYFEAELKKQKETKKISKKFKKVNEGKIIISEIGLILLNEGSSRNIEFKNIEGIKILENRKILIQRMHKINPVILEFNKEDTRLNFLSHYNVVRKKYLSQKEIVKM